ncbi:MAG: hypothetical protein R3C17_10780 [Planctomycetaceae bacterium]
MSFGLFSLERDQNMLTAGLRGKLSWSILSRWSKAQLPSFLTEFVDPWMGNLCSKSTSLELLLLPHPKIFWNSGSSRLFARHF